MTGDERKRGGMEVYVEFRCQAVGSSFSQVMRAAAPSVKWLRCGTLRAAKLRLSFPSSNTGFLLSTIDTTNANIHANDKSLN